MGLDDFLTDKNSDAQSTEASTDNESSVNTKPSEADYELLKVDYDNYEHPSADKDLRAEYDKDYLKECWRCDSKSIRLNFLSRLHDVWFCTDPDCRNSIRYKCEVSARSKDLAQKINTDKAHSIITKEDANPKNMGLEDFIDDDSSTTSSTSSSSSSSSSSSADVDDIGTDPSDHEMNFYGGPNSAPDDRPMDREGPMSDYDVSDLLSEVEDTINIESDDVKFYSPVFFFITKGVEYEGGELYQLNYDNEDPAPGWNGRVVSCLGGYNTPLGQMRQETAMFAVGEHKKSKAMEAMENNLGENIDPDTQVYVNFFGDAFMLRDLAQANSEYKEGDIINRDDVASNILRSKALRSRMSKGDK